MIKKLDMAAIAASAILTAILTSRANIQAESVKIRGSVASGAGAQYWDALSAMGCAMTMKKGLMVREIS